MRPLVGQFSTLVSPPLSIERDFCIGGFGSDAKAPRAGQPEQMHPCRLTTRIARVNASWRPRLALFALLTATCALCGCADAHSPQPDSALVVGAQTAAVRLGPAVRVAERFAAAYARHAYLRWPPRPADVTAGVARQIALAAARVPAARRALRPQLAALSLRPGAAGLSASARIGDGLSPSFSVSFSVKRAAGRWRVVAISLPE